MDGEEYLRLGHPSLAMNGPTSVLGSTRYSLMVVISFRFFQSAVDFDWPGFSGCVMEEAAPGIVFGLLDESAHDWVAVHVSEFLNALVFREDVEVMVAALPELLPLSL